MTTLVITWRVLRWGQLLLWLARIANDPAALRRRVRLGAGLGLLLLAGWSWLLVCGGLLAGLALFGDAAPSALGLLAFVAVPAALSIAAAGSIAWRLRAPASVADAALPVVALWWAVSAVAAYAVCFALT